MGLIVFYLKVLLSFLGLSKSQPPVRYVDLCLKVSDGDQPLLLSIEETWMVKPFYQKAVKGDKPISYRVSCPLFVEYFNLTFINNKESILLSESKTEDNKRDIVAYGHKLLNNCPYDNILSYKFNVYNTHLKNNLPTSYKIIKKNVKYF